MAIKYRFRKNDTKLNKLFEGVNQNFKLYIYDPIKTVLVHTH